MKMRVSKSQWVAAFIVVALAVWMASGMTGNRNASEGAAPIVSASQPQREPTDVQVTQVQAKQVTRYVELQGQAEADRIATVRAETNGRVAELPGERGKHVNEGDELVILAMNDRQARLKEAQALVEQRKSEYEAGQKLGSRGFQSENQVKQARTSLAAAEAQLAAIKEEIENVRILAPFAGTLETRPVEIGNYVSVGDEIATVVDDDPLRIIAHVPQQKVNRINLGAKTDISFITGQKAEGIVSLVSSVADEGTRTYRVEVEMGNAKSVYRPGMSATLRIPTDVVEAQLVSPAIFSLNTEGQLGIKTVNEENKVVFHPVDVIRATADGVWVSGLPASAHVITRGQGFVRAGETVKPVPAGRADGDVPVSGRGPEADAAITGTAG